MRFTASREEMASAVGHAASGIPSNPGSPVYAGMSITCGANAEFRGCDGDVSFASVIRSPAGIERGTAIVPGKLLAEVVRSFSGDTVDFEVSGTTALVSCGRSRFTCPVQGGEYPKEPAPAFATCQVSASALADAVRKVLPATGRSEPALSAVRIIAENQALTAIATDKYRLAVATCPADGTAAFLLPGWAADRVTRSMSGDIAMGADDRVVTLQNDKSWVTSRVIAGKWPKGWEKLLSPGECRAEIDADALTESLRRARLAVEADSPVTLTFTSGELHVDAGAGNRCNDTLEIKYEGEGFEALFGIQNLLDGVAACEGTLQAGFTTPLAPVSLVSGDFRYVVLPRRKI